MNDNEHCFENPEHSMTTVLGPPVDRGTLVHELNDVDDVCKRERALSIVTEELY